MHNKEFNRKEQKDTREKFTLGFMHLRAAFDSIESRIIIEMFEKKNECRVN